MSTISGTTLEQSRRCGDGEDTWDPSCPAGPAQPERERVMVKYAIRHDGRHYEYNRYRYDHLSDAVAYARLMRSRLPQVDMGGPFWLGEPVDSPPNDADRELMAALGIAFEAGVFRFEDFRYDHLADAVNYAKRMASGRAAKVA